MARICSARHGDRGLTIRQKRATRRNARKTSVVVDCCPKAATHWPWVAGLADPKNPMVGRFAGCCASAVSGHAARDAGRLLRCGISAGLMPASGHFPLLSHCTIAGCFPWINRHNIAHGSPAVRKRRGAAGLCEFRAPPSDRAAPAISHHAFYHFGSLSAPLRIRAIRGHRPHLCKQRLRSDDTVRVFHFTSGCFHTTSSSSVCNDIAQSCSEPCHPDVRPLESHDAGNGHSTPVSPRVPGRTFCFVTRFPTGNEQGSLGMATVGNGAYSYEPMENWAKLPPGWSFKEIGGVGVDRNDNVFVFNRGEHPMIVFDREGNFLRSFGRRIVSPRAWRVHGAGQHGVADR